MPSVLSVDGERLLRDMPPYEADDPWVQAVVDVLAQEWRRASSKIVDIVSRSLPHNADDTYRFLEMWEIILRLPVKPTGVSLSDRRSKVLAAIRTRSAVEGYKWVQAVTTALGTADWEHSEGPGPYSISVAIPTTVGYTVGTFETLLRRITPAHLVINVTTASRFIIGAGIQDPTASLIQTDGNVL